MAHSFAAASVVDSETSSERDAIIGDARAPANTSRRLILGLGALSGVLALCSVAALVGYQSLDASEGPAVVSASEAPENLKHRVGCTNWDEIVLKKIENSNDTACHDACHLTPGCHAYNVQESDSAACTDTEHGLKKGTCYIFGEGCRETKNDCWDLYYEKPPIAGWKLETARMGCSNWREAAMSVVKSADQCGAACTANSSCKFFNYQPAACDGPEQNQEGACYLFTSCTELVTPPESGALASTPPPSPERALSLSGLEGPFRAPERALVCAANPQAGGTCSLGGVYKKEHHCFLCSSRWGRGPGFRR